MKLTDKHFFADMQVKKNALPLHNSGGLSSLAHGIEQENLDDYLELYEKAFIKQFLGVEILFLIESKMLNPTDRNIIFGTGKKPKCFLANFIYYNMITATLNNIVDKGGMKNDVNYIRNKRRAHIVWNRGVDLCREAQKLLRMRGHWLPCVDRPIKLRYYDR